MKTIKVVMMVALLACVSSGLRSCTDVDTLRGPNHRWSWMRAIALQPRQTYDFVFTGSSKTLNGIKPVELAKGMPGTASINLAHFKYGHDADYYAVRDLLERHDVKNVIVEIPFVLDPVPHAATSPLIHPGEFGGEVAAAWRDLGWRDFFTYSDLLKGHARRLSDYAGTLVFSWPVHALSAVDARLRGTAEPTVGLDHAWTAVLGADWRDDEIVPKARFTEKWAGKGPFIAPSRPARPPANGLPDTPASGSRHEIYLEQLQAITERHGARLGFLMIPNFRESLPSVARVAYYRQYGDVLIPDLAQLYRLENYADPLHLYGAGATLFTSEVARLLRDGPPASPYFDAYRGAEAGPGS